MSIKRRGLTRSASVYYLTWTLQVHDTILFRFFVVFLILAAFESTRRTLDLDSDSQTTPPPSPVILTSKFDTRSSFAYSVPMSRQSSATLVDTTVDAKLSSITMSRQSTSATLVDTAIDTKSLPSSTPRQPSAPLLDTTVAARSSGPLVKPPRGNASRLPVPSITITTTNDETLLAVKSPSVRWYPVFCNERTDSPIEMESDSDSVSRSSSDSEEEEEEMQYEPEHPFYFSQLKAQGKWRSPLMDAAERKPWEDYDDRFVSLNKVRRIKTQQKWTGSSRRGSNEPLWSTPLPWQRARNPRGFALTPPSDPDGLFPTRQRISPWDTNLSELIFKPNGRLIVTSQRNPYNAARSEMSIQVTKALLAKYQKKAREERRRLQEKAWKEQQDRARADKKQRWGRKLARVRAQVREESILRNSQGLRRWVPKRLLRKTTRREEEAAVAAAMGQADSQKKKKRKSYAPGAIVQRWLVRELVGKDFGKAKRE